MRKLGKSVDELIDVDFPKRKPITETTREVTRRAASRYRTDMRPATGRISTSAAYQERRKKILNTPLP